jgi:pimeloyl-ACP methyl ester carboxylesterase
MGDYVELPNAKLWYETAGTTGEPLLLLHGGMSDGSSWGLHATPLSERFRVVMPDQRGHGRSPDLDGPLTYDAMADDTIAFIETVVGEPAHLVGWSDGGILAILISLRRPDLVRRQVLIGANFHHEGLIPGTLELSDPDDPTVAIFKAMYEAVTVDGPEHWPVFFHKTTSMWVGQPALTVEDVARITTPTLVLIGDDEPIYLAHTVALYEALADAQLAVIPGASHIVPFEKPDVVRDLITAFLGETAPPATMAPVRRATK